MKFCHRVVIFMEASGPDLQRNRAVVTAEDIGVDGGGDDPFLKTVGCQKIIDPPSGVVLSGVETIAPPGVGACKIRI